MHTSEKEEFGKSNQYISDKGSYKFTEHRKIIM